MNPLKIKTIETYNQNSKQIAEKAAEYFIKYRYLADDFLLELKNRRYPRHASTTILDLGCGSGEATEYMHGHFPGFRAMGVDLSDGMLEEARKKNIQVKKMDIENLEFAPAYFDGIWSMCSLVHLEKENMLDVLRSLHNILKSDGRLFICLKAQSEVFLRNFLGKLVCVSDEDGVPTTTPPWFIEKDNRFLSYWRKEEFLEVIKPMFTVVASSEICRTTKNAVTSFLCFTLKKGG